MSMNTIFEEAEDDEIFARAEDTSGEQDREVTLSSATVLGIFFGSVLICALCFGAGYALGRRSAPRSAEVPSAAKSAAERVEMNPVAETPEYRAKPSASSQEVSQQEAAAPKDSAEDAGAVKEANRQIEDKPVAAPAVKKAASVPAVVKAASAPAAGTYMVQIAAVSNAADAEALRGALSKRGYTVVIRHESADALLHVQTGPFTSRADAAAMRQKLLGDGYNAILK